jgi:UDP-N-acetylglucosamine:LPS N-acetylglucosamine transferase
MVRLLKLKRKIGVSCSAGGHLTEALLALNGINDEDIFLVTFRTEYLKEFEKKYRFYYVPNPFELKNGLFLLSIKLILNIALSLYIFFKEKPALIFSTGAGVAIPFCIIGKLFGSKLVYLETGASVKDLSKTGKLVYKLTNDFFVQWKELTEKYTKAKCTSILSNIKILRETKRNDINFSQILIVGFVGTLPFDRLVLSLKNISDKYGFKLCIQTSNTGVTFDNSNKKIVNFSFVSYSTMLQWIKSADIIVTHGGYGTILNCIICGKIPIAFPRDPSLGEHKHEQIELLEKLSQLELIDLVSDTSILEKKILEKIREQKKIFATINLSFAMYLKEILDVK